MSTKTNYGGFSVIQSGTAPNVQMQLMSASIAGTGTSVYNQYPIQQSAWFTCSFQIYMSGNGDELNFYAGASAPVGCGVSCSGSGNGGVVVGFDVYSGFGGGAGRTGPGIYLMNSAGTIVASAAFSANSAWESVSITYTQGTTNTWVVSWKGSVVLSYSDPTNPSWVSSAGNYWGFGARDGAATGNFYISLVSLLLAPAILPGTNSCRPVDKDPQIIKFL